MAQKECDARTSLSSFVTQLADLQTWLPSGSLGETTTYEPSGSRVYVRGRPPRRRPPATEGHLAAGSAARLLRRGHGRGVPLRGRDGRRLDRHARTAGRRDERAHAVDERRDLVRLALPAAPAGRDGLLNPQVATGRRHLSVVQEPLRRSRQLGGLPTVRYRPLSSNEYETAAPDAWTAEGGFFASGVGANDEPLEARYRNLEARYRDLIDRLPAVDLPRRRRRARDDGRHQPHDRIAPRDHSGRMAGPPHGLGGDRPSGRPRACRRRERALGRHGRALPRRVPRDPPRRPAPVDPRGCGPDRATTTARPATGSG